MAHHTVRGEYKKLSERLNKFPQGAPQTELLFKILSVLFSKDEANLVSKLPLKPFTSQKASKIWNKSVKETEKILNKLAERGLMLDTEKEGTTFYVLPPPMAGFFEFSLMRIRDDINQKLLSELFYQYITVEDDFVKALFCNGETQLGRVFVNEESLEESLSLHVLDYEKASEVIHTASDIGLGTCYCRHKKMHLGTACNAPLDICMTFNATATSLIKHQIARRIDKSECLDLLLKSYDYNLVQFGENVQNNVSFICNCCGCCCEALIVAKKFAFLNPVHTTQYIPTINSSCTGCGKCVNICPVDAITLENMKKNESKKKFKIAVIDSNRCLGCGVCERHCQSNSIKMEKRKETILTPVNTAHRTVMMAIERGQLQNLIFDNQALSSHRAMAAVLGVILKLPGIKQTMASKQIKSRYLGQLIKKHFD